MKENKNNGKNKSKMLKPATMGFTLIELLGVIIVIGILSMVALPSIINQMNRSKNEVSAATLRVLYAAGEIYLDQTQATYHQTSGNTFCITLKELVDQGQLEQPILDATSGEELSLTNILKYTVDSRGLITYNYALYTNATCTQVNH